MSINIRFPAKNVHGKLHIIEKDSFEQYLHSMPEQVDVIICKKKKPARSNNQNRYYWGIIVSLFSEETGYSPEEAHEIFKYKFLRETRVITGRNNKLVTFEITKSTTDLTTAEFEDYCAKIRMWCSCELGINLPEPDEVY